MVSEFSGKKPRINVAYIDTSSVIIGDVEIEDGVGIYPNTTIRGDDDSIILKRGAMILDNCVIEAPKGRPVVIGEKTIISHGAIVHGARVGDRSVIGIGAILLDGSVIGDECLIAAGSVVPPEARIPNRSLVLGVPGKVVKDVSDSLLIRLKKEYKALEKKFDEYKARRGILSEDR
jgi:carbonic anhydrase/acetyltransferase-like protein (isoleucine patch superfamily)